MFVNRGFRGLGLSGSGLGLSQTDLYNWAVQNQNNPYLVINNGQTDPNYAGADYPPYTLYLSQNGGAAPSLTSALNLARVAYHYAAQLDHATDWNAWLQTKYSYLIQLANNPAAFFNWVAGNETKIFTAMYVANWTWIDVQTLMNIGSPDGGAWTSLSAYYASKNQSVPPQFALPNSVPAPSSAPAPSPVSQPSSAPAPSPVSQPSSAPSPAPVPQTQPVPAPTTASPPVSVSTGFDTSPPTSQIPNIPATGLPTGSPVPNLPYDPTGGIPLNADGTPTTNSPAASPVSHHGLLILGGLFALAVLSKKRS